MTRFLLLALVSAAAINTAPLVTVYEQSGLQKTGRYEEVMFLCRAFEKNFPGKARCLEFGKTPEGRPMHAIAASADGVLEPTDANRKGRPVVLFQGGIHAGEIEGKDAGLMLLRDLLNGKVAPGLLSRVTAVFVPVFNVDGHERFGAHNRPNQTGPAEMGWRVTSSNLNLNRDYTKADAPEMQSMLRLLSLWDPVMYIDLHATDGAQFAHDVAVLIEPQLVGPPALRAHGLQTRLSLLKKLEAQGHTPLHFYPSFEKDDDPTSGFAVGAPPPRFSTGYWPLHNRFAVLVETHSWKTYAERVKATYDVVLGLLEQAAQEGANWLATGKKLDEEDTRLAATSIDLLFDHSDSVKRIKFKGYKYRRELSAVSGAMRIIYDPTKPEDWDVPLWDEAKPVMSVKAPTGYIVPAGHAAWMADKLKLHGLTFSTIKDTRQMSVEVFRAVEKKFKPEPYEGRLTVQVKGEWKAETRQIAAGSIFVPVGQRGGKLLVHLMEPMAPDSFLAWGFFNASFEQKEYMEAYVAEDVARQMMDKSPQLKAEFEKKLESDPEFAKSPAARLNFFYQRHPSWDVALNLYPVLRATTAP